jgi:hypothetical protein
MMVISRRESTMATAEAALAKMRAICLALPGSSEAVHFGEACFRVGKRIFASCGGEAGFGEVEASDFRVDSDARSP